MSSDRRTNETAMASTSSATRAAMRSRSSGVGVASVSLLEGTVTPGRPMTLPPERTRASTSSPRRPSTTREMPPSPSETTSPSARLATTSSTATPIRVAELAGVLEPGESVTSAPASSITPCFGKAELRIFGPGRSGRIPMRGAILRIWRMSPIAWSVVLCANETRATSIPAATRDSSTAGLLEAGPIVATIRVRRPWWRGRRAWVRTSSRNGSEAWSESAPVWGVLGGSTPPACPMAVAAAESPVGKGKRPRPRPSTGAGPALEALRAPVSPDANAG